MEERITLLFAGSVEEFECWLEAQKLRYKTLEEFVIRARLKKE